MERPVFGIGNFKPRALQRLATVQYFGAFLSLFGFVVGILPMYSVSQITSFEKHFGLSSQQAGTIVASSEIGFIATSLITGHFLSPMHRPRIIGICALLTSLACYAMTLPFLLHTDRLHTSRTTTGHVNTEVSLCGVKPDCGYATNTSDSGLAYYCFLACTILSGIGSTSFYTLGVSYVDDNASEKMAPTYIGFVLSLRFAAPAFGLLLGAATATVPVHFQYSTLNSLDYVGAWWIGYYVIGTLALLSGLPILMFPKKLKVTRAVHAMEMNNTNNRRSSETEQATDETETLQDEIQSKTQLAVQEVGSRRLALGLVKDFPKALYRLISTPAFDLLALSMTMDICGMVGFVAFAPKYVEAQFNTGPATANFIIGLAIPAATSFGIMVSGRIMSQSDKNLREKVLASIITMLLIYGSFPFLLFFKCPSVSIEDYKTVNRCHEHCSCTINDFTSICGSDGRTYYSPCHAGCTDFNSAIFTQCACIHGNRTAVKGHCTPPCNAGQVIGYATIQFVINFISTMATMPVIMLSLRIVKPGDKSLSLAVINVVASMFIFPTPIVFGTLIDSTCTLQFPLNACSASSGACAYYDKDRFRMVLHLLGTALKVSSPLLLLGSWFAGKKLTLAVNDAEERPESTRL